MPTFGQLAEVHALVPPCPPLMACIATATKSVKKDIIDSVEMSAGGGGVIEERPGGGCGPPQLLANNTMNDSLL